MFDHAQHTYVTGGQLNHITNSTQNIIYMNNPETSTDHFSVIRLFDLKFFCSSSSSL